MNYLKKIEKLVENHIVEVKRYEYHKNSNLLETYFNIGKLLIEAQGGEAKAKYGDNLLKEYSKVLTKKYGKGYDDSNLRRMRALYLTFQKCGSVSHELSWTHYRKILSIKDINKRNYYINLAIDKKLSEKALKKYILDSIEKFILELGVGFYFGGSEKKIKVGDTYKYIDLVFFNVNLNCYVLLELKINKLNIRDIGQLEFYIKYYDANIKETYHNQTIGIIVCQKSEKEIENILNKDNIKITSYEIKE